MEKQISFSGIDLTPYSDISPDGQCSILHGVELHNASLRPAKLVGKRYSITTSTSGTNTVKPLATDYVLEHLHSTSAYRHLIFRGSDKGIYWADDSGDGGTLYVKTVYNYITATKVTSVGNTLVALTDDGVYYFLWSNGSYKYIGNKIPEIGIQFGVCGAFSFDTDSSTTATNYNDPGIDDITVSGTINEAGTTVTFKNDTSDIDQRNDKYDATTFSNYVWANVNYITDKAKKESNFIAPFFVRYAYKLYDGSITMASHPALMIPTTIGLFRTAAYGTNPYTFFLFDCRYKFKLCLNVVDSSTLSNWKDIISSVDIYVTPQTTPWSYGSLITTISYSIVNEDSFGIFADTGSDNTATSFSQSSFIKKSFYGTSTSILWNVDLPLKTRKVFEEELLSNMQFYKISSYKVDEIETLSSSLYYRVNFKNASLYNLEQQELLDESYDYRSHDTLIPSNAYVYNSRLHIFNIKRKLFNGFEYRYTNPIAYNDGAYNTIAIHVYIHGDDGLDRRVSTSCYIYQNISFVGRFFYYPDARAYKMTIDFGLVSYNLPLTSHPLLNGSYYLCWDDLDGTTSAGDTSLSNEPILENNKIYVSDVDNPYIFPSTGVYTVGTGEILGIASIATPLSTGQLGQFKLMFFCSDGNYALTVADDGTYSTITAIQRDVCQKASSITVLDSEVLFLSDKGAMVTNAASVQCINQQLDGVPESLPSEFPTTSTLNVLANISGILKATHVAYDYANGRIIFFRGGYGDLVYSILNKAWSTANLASPVAVLNIYPYSYIQTSGTSIVLLTNSYSYDDSAATTFYIYTRPLKLDTLQLKKLHQFTLQGIGVNSAIIYLYGSQDCQTWTLIGSTSELRRRHIRGRSFKYYRFAIQGSLSSTANITGMRLEYEPSKSGNFR